MKETYLYRGHSIKLDLSGTAYAGIRWTYFIDEHYCFQGTMTSLPMATVRFSALELAHRSIDLLDAMRAADVSPKPPAANPSCIASAVLIRDARRTGPRAAPKRAMSSGA